MIRLSHLSFVLIFCTLPFSAGNVSAVEVRSVDAFLKNHCYDCHADGASERGLDLKQLGNSLDDPALFAKWERIHDRVAAGEMPPKASDQPPAQERAGFLTSLSTDLTAAHVAYKGTVLRRLNRQEYENTLNDMFGTNLKIIHRLPEDSRSHEFDNVGEALGISMVQLERYLECAKDVLDESIVRSLGPPEKKVTKASYADTRGAEQWLNKIWLHRPDGAVVFFRQTGYPSGMLREANVQQDGWYNVRVTGYAFQSDKPVTFSIGATTFARGADKPTYGYFAMPPGKPTTIEIKAWVPARYMIDVSPYGLVDEGNQIRQNGVQSYKGPGLAIQHVEVEGPLVDEFPSRGHHLVFDGLDRQEIMPRNPRDRERSYYVPKFEIKSDIPLADVTPVLTRVASRAFRRPVESAHLSAYVELFEAQMKLGSSFEDALRSAVSAILCAPDFVYLRELPHPDAHSQTAEPLDGSYWLDDYALASRLSYFLTRSLPDQELLEAAAAGKLSKDPATLLAQTERLLRHPHSERFVKDFTDAWLNLRDIEFTNPDGQLFPEFDQFLQFSMLAESREFFRKLLDDNLSVGNVVKSDFAMLNNRLAEHYEIAGVAGPEIRAVPLPADSVRGGFLSQAAVLKVSANGTNTSPVVRGVWVTERILGQLAPPPPPGVPGVEPDIRGATTLRELLDKHRSLETCRGCHKAIDPPGFALESFDPVGIWRERFRSLGDGDRVDKEVHGSRVRYKLGPPVDASGEMPDGRKFAGFIEFRDLLAQDNDLLAQTLATKLLTFATGREMGFSDREEIERIVQQSAQTQHGMRDLIRHVVVSSIFRRK